MSDDVLMVSRGKRKALTSIYLGGNIRLFLVFGAKNEVCLWIFVP